MADINSLKEASKELALQVAKEVYGDAVKPSAKTVGLALEDIASSIRLVTLPFRMIGYAPDLIFEKYKSFMIKVFNKVPKDKVRKPDMQIAGQVLEDVKYVFDVPELQEMYSNLLANNLNTESFSLIHPSFSSIIRELTPFEAVLLKYLHARKSLNLSSLIHNENRYSENVENEKRLSLLMVLDIDEWVTPEEIAIAIQNLHRLSLIFVSEFSNEISVGDQDTSLHNIILHNPNYLLENYKIGKETFEAQISKIELTVLGKKFCCACIS